MSVLDREALEQSPLADLHAIASELSIDSYRLLRRAQLVQAILTRQEGSDGGGSAKDGGEDSATTRPATRQRRRRSRQERGAPTEAEVAAPASATGDAGPGPTPVAEDDTAPRTADATADRARFESLPARFPDESLGLTSDDPIVAAIESLAPIGRGSRVTVVGPARAGKTEVLRRLTIVLQGREDLDLFLLLVGVRPEEVGEWQSGPLQPVQALSFAAPTSAQDRAVYGVIDEVRAVALRGGNAVLLLDTLDGLHEHAARRALAVARKLVDGGSVTLIATSTDPMGGETTVIALDPGLPGGNRFPPLDPRSSGTLRAELLVGEDGAAKVANERAKRLKRIAR
jgi:transcription termination factor Rho